MTGLYAFTITGKVFKLDIKYETFFDLDKINAFF